MNHVRQIKVLESLREGEDVDSIDVKSGITAVNMVANYKLISSVLDEVKAQNAAQLGDVGIFFSPASCCIQYLGWNHPCSDGF